MTTSHSNTAPAWFGRNEGSDWTTRIGDAARLVFDAANAGFNAEHEYNKLTRHGVTPQDASATVFKHHFGRK